MWYIHASIYIHMHTLQSWKFLSQLAISHPGHAGAAASDLIGNGSLGGSNWQQTGLLLYQYSRSQGNHSFKSTFFSSCGVLQCRSERHTAFSWHAHEPRSCLLHRFSHSFIVCSSPVQVDSWSTKVVSFYFPSTTATPGNLLTSSRSWQIGNVNQLEHNCGLCLKDHLPRFSSPTRALTRNTRNMAANSFDF